MARPLLARWRAPALVAFGLGLASCSTVASSDDALDALRRLPQPPTTPPATTSGPPRDVCLDTASYRPGPQPRPGDMPEGTILREIQDRGYLRVGVDENTLGLASRNTTTGEIEGFEVDLAHEVAKRIFGEREGILQLVPTTTDEKLPFAHDGKVDLTVSAFSMTCRRWEEVAFSSEYYRAVQQFLVRKELRDRDRRRPGRPTGVRDGRLDVDRPPAEVPPRRRGHPVKARTDCLLALQEGQVAAYFGHDSFLYGLMDQDPTVEVVPGIIPEELTLAPYGMATSLDNPELVRFVNAVLDELRANGTWAALHDKLEERLGIPDADPPTPRYRD